MIILRKLFSVSDSIDWFKGLASEFKKRFKGCAFSVSVGDCSYQYRESKGHECVVVGYDDQDWVVIFQDENGNWFDASSKNLAPVKNPKEFIIDTVKRVEPEYDFESLSKHPNVALWDKDCWKAYNWLLDVLGGKQKCFTDTAIWYQDGIHLYKDGEKIDDIIEVIPKNKLQFLQKACETAGKDCWEDMKSFLSKYTSENNFIGDFKIWGINVHTGKIPGIELYGKSSLQGLKSCLFFG